MTETPLTPTAEEQQQTEMPFAMVQGEPVVEVPKDLYIPPDALEVFLDAFEGPLDLLLYLIRKQNMDILDIPIVQITKQYMEYVDLMKEVRLELAAEYLVMAAMLAEIKSRMLLPRPEGVDDDEDDPRAELIRRLQEYERFKQAAEDIDALPRMGRDIHQAAADFPDKHIHRPLPTATLQDMLAALQDVLQRAELFTDHKIERESLSIRERMSKVLEIVSGRSFVPFAELFTYEEGRMGVVVSFMAVLELVKESLIEVVQNEAYSPIHIREAGSAVTAEEPQ